MAQPNLQAVEDELVQLNYIQSSDIFLREKPYEVVSQTPAGLEKSNFQLKPGPPETIQDLRGRESHFHLDQNGFQVVPHLLQTTDFNEETVKKEYLPAVESLLKTIEPGIEVHFFDWQLRSSDRPDPKPGTTVNLNDPMLLLRPVQAVHVDQSPYGAMKRTKKLLGNDASDLQDKRIRIINVWRPIRHPVENYPLAVCDGRSVPREKLIEVDHVRKHFVSESLYPVHSAGYQWHYLNRQTRDEVLLFKMFDSKEGVPARYCPHTSFCKSKVSPSTRPRESIEVRALILSQN